MLAAALILCVAITNINAQSSQQPISSKNRWPTNLQGSRTNSPHRHAARQTTSNGEKYVLHPSLTQPRPQESQQTQTSRGGNQNFGGYSARLAQQSIPKSHGTVGFRPAYQNRRSQPVQQYQQPTRIHGHRAISRVGYQSLSPEESMQIYPAGTQPGQFSDAARLPIPDGQFTPPANAVPSARPGIAQDSSYALPPQQQQIPLQPLNAGNDGRTFVFNFNKAPWQLVLRKFAQEFGMSLQVSHTVIGEFTYYDQTAYSVPEAINIFNDYLLPQGAILIHHANKLTLAGANTEIPDGFIPFVRITDLPVIGRNHLATIAIPLERADPVATAEEISRFLSPVGRVEPLSNSQRVVVTDTGAYLRRIFDLVTGAGIASREPTSSVYELRHAQAEDVAKAINEFYAQRIGGGPAGAGDESQQIVVAEKTTKSIIIRDAAGKGSEVYSLIQQMDRPPRQVLIQALIVEVQLGNTDEFGVELGFQDSVLFDRSIINDVLTVTETTTAPGGIQTTNQRILSQSAAPGFNFNNQPLGNNVAISPATVAGQALSSLGVGRVNGDLGYGGLVLSAGSESINVLLRALTTRFDVDILSRPQVRAVDNHEALIQIGQQVPVVDGVNVTANGSANPVIRQDKAGIILKVTPQISPESNVLIDVQAEKSAFQTGNGVPIFVDGTNGNVIEAPRKDITTANTLVSVRSGQTIVLGGMITNEESVIERKVPFLGDIPIIKHAFRHDLRSSTRKELLIFLTPHVIESEHHSRELDEQIKSHVHIPDSAYEFPDLGGGGHSFGLSGDGCVIEQ